jgi:hypothetical protein
VSAAAPSGWARCQTRDFARTSILLHSGLLVLLFTTDAAQRFIVDHSLAVRAVTILVADVEDAFCASLRRALGSSVRALPALRSTPQRCRWWRRDQLLVHTGAREAVLVHAEHEAVVNPAAHHPSLRSSDASAVPYACFTDMWVRPVILRQS